MSTAAYTPLESQRRVGRRLWQRCLAELIGTFALVFAGCGATITDGASRGGLGAVGIALTFGLVIGAAICALGPISAAHFNPAVTVGLATVRRFPWRGVAPYVASQVAGALLASGLHGLLYAAPTAAVSYGATLPSAGPGASLAFEAVMTFFLMLVIMGVATDDRASGASAGVAIGGTVALCSLFGGALTGASMNPARSLGPAIFAGAEAMSVYWIYMAGPLIGGVIAARVYEAMRDGETHARSAPSDW